MQFSKRGCHRRWGVVITGDVSSSQVMCCHHSWGFVITTVASLVWGGIDPGSWLLFQDLESKTKFASIFFIFELTLKCRSSFNITRNNFCQLFKIPYISQNNFLEGVLQSKLDEQELRWKEKMEQMNLQHQREIAKVVSSKNCFLQFNKIFIIILQVTVFVIVMWYLINAQKFFSQSRQC